MNTIILFGSAVILILSGLFVAIHRESRWGVIAWWLNGVSASSILLIFGSELLAIALALGASLAATAYFFHADTFSEAGRRDEFSARSDRAHRILSALVSAALGLTVFSVLKAITSGAVRSIGAPSLGAGFFPEESFVAIQLVALLGLVLVLGVGVISRPRGPNA
ncbi:MAG: hypothetical protein KGQ59_06765 [Bdellovibrionales bacterium]|nr:hypothetical protein [Bdellovibrionales bacterium]